MKTSLWSAKMNLLVLNTLIMVLAFGISAASADDAAKTVTPETPPAAPAIDFKTDLDKVSYLIGTQIGGGFAKQDIDINVDMLIMGIKDSVAGKPPVFDQAEAQQVMMDFQKTMQAKMMAKQQAESEKQLGQENMWKVKLEKPEMMTFDAATDYYWVLETNKGTIKIKLMPDIAPMHVTSTIFLTKKGFYDDLAFHRVIPGFMAQGGCPLGTGTGGPGYKYDGEFSDKVKHDKPYLLSMANAGPGTDGSQFFLTFKETPWLDGKHTIFGEITEGQDVMKKLEEAGTPSGKSNEELKIIEATIEEVKK